MDYFSFVTFGQNRRLILPKILFAVLLLYLTWFNAAFGANQIILYAAALLLYLSVAFDMAFHGCVIFTSFPKYLKACFALAIYAFLSGLIVAGDKAWLLSQLMRYIAFCGVCFCMYYISRAEGNVKWFLRLNILCGLVCAVYSMFFGHAMTAAGAQAIVLSDKDNPNMLGLIMLIATFSVLLDIREMKKHIVRNLFLVALFSYTIINTASRKNVVCLGLLLAVWVITFFRSFRTERANAVSVKTIFVIIVVLGGIAFAIYYLLNEFINSGAFYKLYNTITTGSGTESRLYLYQEAWSLFKKSPFFGIGFDQFRLRSKLGLYSHSTYAEVLSCCGLFGAAIYLIPQVVLLFNMAKQIICTKGKDDMLLMVLAFFVIELILSFVQITFYSCNHMLMLTFIFYWYQENMRQRSSAGGMYV